MQAHGTRGELAAGRILLVEDADDIRLAGRESFDVLLTDLGLPDIPGDILIREILAIAPLRPNVVVVTGYGEPYASRAREAGADVVLTKPIEWTLLLRQLQKSLRSGPAGDAGAVAA